MISGISSRLFKGWPYFFCDFQSVACAGRAALAGVDIYTAQDMPICKGLEAKPYIYIPAVADASGWVTSMIGGPAFFWAYVTVFVCALGYLLWILVMDKSAPAPLSARLLGLGMVTGSGVAWGNFAVVLHALVALASRVAYRAPLVFVAAVASAAAMKPTFAAYLFVFLLAPWPAWKRLAWAGGGAAVAMAPLALFILGGGPEVDTWRRAAEGMVLDVQLGDGAFGVGFLLGVDAREPVMFLGYAVFAAVVIASCLQLVERMRPSNADRIWLGLSAAVLIDPRFQSYDVFLLAPGAIVAARSIAGLDASASRTCLRIVTCGLAAALVMNVLDLAEYANKTAFLCMSLTLAAAAVRSLFPASALARKRLPLDQAGGAPGLRPARLRKA
jgi:hypothetical protein